MARGNRRVTVEQGGTFDDFADSGESGGAAVATSGVTQPPPVDPTEGQMDGKAILARLFNMDVGDVQALVKLKEEANTFALASQAQQHAAEAKSRLELEHKRQWAGKSCRDRTQEVVDRTWGKEEGNKVFRVALVKNPDARGEPESITLDIPAHSVDEARGRYTSICGIISTDHHIRAAPLDEIRTRQARRREDEMAFAGAAAGENEAGEIVDPRRFMES